MYRVVEAAPRRWAGPVSAREREKGLRLTRWPRWSVGTLRTFSVPKVPMLRRWGWNSGVTSSIGCRIELALEDEESGTVSQVKGEEWEVEVRGKRDTLYKGTEARGSKVRWENCRWFTLAAGGRMKRQEGLHETCPRSSELPALTGSESGEWHDWCCSAASLSWQKSRGWTGGARLGGVRNQRWGYSSWASPAMTMARAERGKEGPGFQILAGEALQNLVRVCGWEKWWEDHSGRQWHLILALCITN